MSLMRDGMIAYLRRHQNPDGGYGLHVEGPSCVFTSVLNYVALRMLGVEKEDAAIVRCREWFLPRGGPLGSAPWGKFFLSILNLHDYRGLHPVLPELWRLPRWFPLHPRRLWCHARMVYLPMAYLYGTSSQCELTPLLLQLREEIYAEPYAGISWASNRNTISETDVYRPHTRPLKAAHRLLGAYARRPWREWRKRALRLRAGRHRF